jgi:hypothetical protein
VTRKETNKNVYRGLLRNPGENRPLVRPRYKRGKNIK